MSETTREPQYQQLLEYRDEHGLTPLGLMTNVIWRDDPRHFAWLFSRYKFVSKMLAGSGIVLEVGCADAFATRVVLQEVGQLTAVDFDPILVKDVNDRMDTEWSFTCRVHNILEGPVQGAFDGAYALDVLEHIPEKDEDRFVSNIVRSLTEHGVLILGTPSIQSQAYASPQSKEGHVNCKDHHALKELASRFFNNVFIFSMNDEVVHTGFYPMAQYLIALCCSKK